MKSNLITLALFAIILSLASAQFVFNPYPDLNDNYHGPYKKPKDCMLCLYTQCIEYTTVDSFRTQCIEETRANDQCVEKSCKASGYTDTCIMLNCTKNTNYITKYRKCKSECKN